MGLIHLFENKMDMPIHGSYYEHFGYVLDTGRHDSVHYTVKACIIRPKRKSLRNTKMCLAITRHIFIGQVGSQGKKEQIVLLYP
jgi:hypothetical protein